MSQEKFYTASRKERELLTKIIPLLAKNNSYDVEYSPVEGFDIWDAKLYMNGKKMLFEVKCRDKFYDTLFLEVLKFNDLMKYKKDNGFDAVYYINDTPNGVYMARIDNKVFNHTSYILCPVATCDPSKGKVRKAVYELDVKNDMKKIGIKKTII